MPSEGALRLKVPDKRRTTALRDASTWCGTPWVGPRPCEMLAPLAHHPPGAAPPWRGTLLQAVIASREASPNCPNTKLSPSPAWGSIQIQCRMERSGTGRILVPWSAR